MTTSGKLIAGVAGAAVLVTATVTILSNAKAEPSSPKTEAGYNVIADSGLYNAEQDAEKHSVYEAIKAGLFEEQTQPPMTPEQEEMEKLEKARKDRMLAYWRDFDLKVIDVLNNHFGDRYRATYSEEVQVEELLAKAVEAIKSGKLSHEDEKTLMLFAGVNGSYIKKGTALYEEAKAVEERINKLSKEEIAEMQEISDKLNGLGWPLVEEE
jgi:hypothetical protein